MQVVTIDPGHGGRDPGAVAGDVTEKEFALDVSHKMCQVLEHWDYDIIMTRDMDEFVGLDERTNIANTAGSDIFVSIHANAFHDSQANGTETYHYPTSLDGELLAGRIQEQLTANIKRACRGVKSAGFHVLRATRMPAVLVEVVFITYDGKAELINDKCFRWLTATGVCGGIRNYIR